MGNILDFSSEVVGAFLGVLVLIFVDTALGIVLSITRNEFDVRQLPRFLQTSVLPYAGGLTILALAVGNPELKALFFASAAGTGLKFLAELKDKLLAIFGKGASA